MDCAGVAGHLVAYHLGTVSDEERDVVEGHLVGCSACLKTYLALKRAADRAELERPRPEVKARLRAEVARAFPAPANEVATPKRRPVLARRIPLYQGVALAALAAAVAVAAPGVLQRVSRADASAGAPSIDTSRTRAESLQIY
jgi:anti-sigma factor RsiW